MWKFYLKFISCFNWVQFFVPDNRGKFAGLFLDEREPNWHKSLILTCCWQNFRYNAMMRSCETKYPDRWCFLVSVMEADPDDLLSCQFSPLWNKTLRPLTFSKLGRRTEISTFSALSLLMFILTKKQHQYKIYKNIKNH